LKYIVIIAILLIVSIVVIRARQSGTTTTELRTETVKTGNVVATVSATGVLQPLTTVEVKSNVGGEIVELTVDEGDVVKAGQLIARIDPSDSLTNLSQAEADFRGAEARVNQSKQGSSMQQLQTAANIASAQQALESSRQRLAQAESQAKIQPTLTTEAIKQAASALASAQATLTQTKSALVPQKLASARAAYDQAKATYDQSQFNFTRQQALLEKGFVSKSQLEAAEQQFSVAKAQLNNAKIKLDTVKDEAFQDLSNAQARYDQSKSALETARTNRIQDSLKQQDLAVAKAAFKQSKASLDAVNATSYQNQMKVEDILQAQSQLERAKAAVKNAHTQVSYCTITAPRAGVVVKKYVDKGSIVTAGRAAVGGGSGSGITIVDIADTTHMWVVVNVDETDIGKIQLGQRVSVRVDAYPKEKFKALVIKIAPLAVVDQNVTTVPVTVELERINRQLKPQMNATCDFIIGNKRNVLCLPSAAIKETKNGMTVSVLANGKQETRVIQVGLAGDDYTEIISGLKEGDIVVDGNGSTSSKGNGTGSTTTTGQRRGGPPRMF
jgi:HlyD family secretion protein